MSQPKKAKRWTERTFSRDRTISARKSAGTKRPRNTSSPYHEGGFYENNFNAPPMNLRQKSKEEFLDIDTMHGSSAFRRVLDNRPPLASKYT